LATPSGIVSTTGVGGLTLGRGIGHLTRKYGLTIDNLLQADVVLADGHLVSCSSAQNADLFWALRGGGGNFGIVTSFLFRLHPVETVIAGPTLWPIEQAQQTMQWYRDFIASAPDDLNGFFTFLIVPPAAPFPEHLHLKNLCGVLWCYVGSAEQADTIFKPVRDFGPPLLHAVGPMPYPALQSAFDGLYPPGLQWYWRADFINQLSDDAIALHAKFGSAIPTPHSTSTFTRSTAQPTASASARPRSVTATPIGPRSSSGSTRTHETSSVSSAGRSHTGTRSTPILQAAHT